MILRGRPRVTRHGHPRANKRGQVYTHLIVAEEAIGFPILLPHVVHHVDGDRFNNVASNLVVCEDVGYHNMLHARQRAYEATGDPEQRMCTYCKEYDTLAKLKVYNGSIMHARCSQADSRIRYNKRKLKEK